MAARKATAGSAETAEVDAATEPAGKPESRPVDFYGRQIQAKRPTPEQVAVWQRVAKRFAAIDKDTMTNDSAMRSLDQAMRVVESTLADPDDMEWLEDQLLSGLMRLDQVVGIIGLVADAWNDNTAAAAPTNGPAPKARRR